MPNFTIVALKCGPTAPKIAKICIFWHKFAKRSNLCDFLKYKIWLWKGCPRYPHTKINRCGFKNVGLQPPKSKKGNFWYKFAPKGKFRGSTEKVEYRCSTENLPLCNDTIIVLKITLLHSISVITNFVIPKCDKQTDKTKKSHFSSTVGATHNPHHVWHGDRGGLSHFCTP